MQDCWSAPCSVAADFIRAIVAVLDLVAAAACRDTLIAAQAFEGVPAQLASSEVTMVLLAQSVPVVGRVDNEVSRFARHTRQGWSATGPAKGRDEGIVSFQIFDSEVVIVAGDEVRRQKARRHPLKLQCARFGDHWWDVWRFGGLEPLQSQVCRASSCEVNCVTVVDLCNGLLRVGFGGWARLPRINAVDDVRVHSPQQAEDNAEAFPLPLPFELQQRQSCALWQRRVSGHVTLCGPPRIPLHRNTPANKVVVQIQMHIILPVNVHSVPNEHAVLIHSHLILVAPIGRALPVPCMMLAGSVVHFCLKDIAIINLELPGLFQSCAFKELAVVQLPSFLHNWKLEDVEAKMIHSECPECNHIISLVDLRIQVIRLGGLGTLVVVFIWPVPRVRQSRVWRQWRHA